MLVTVGGWRVKQFTRITRVKIITRQCLGFKSYVFELGLPSEW